ncbi:MAG: GrpB family protein [Chloroflexota bacterium]
MTVTLVEEYDTLWPLWFEQLKTRLEGVLHGIHHVIEHVGSTAVPGMTAKPIIDIVIVCEPGGFPVIRDRMATIGYVHRGDLGIQGREAFNATEVALRLNLPPHHLYACEKGNQALLEHLAFRDFMRQHPEWRQKLNALKWSLCEKYDDDRQAYIDGKSAMVREITELALKSRE